MKVKIHYSKVQYEACIKFIAENNPSFLGQYDYVRKRIDNSIQEMGHDFPHMTGVGSMGYYISADYHQEEGLDYDENLLILDFDVDPAISNSKKYDDDDVVNVIVENNLEDTLE